MNNNRLLWILGIIVVLMFAISFGGKIFIDKVADRVIQRLQKDYSPSPYGPGLDPDRINWDSINKKK